MGTVERKGSALLTDRLIGLSLFDFGFGIGLVLCLKPLGRCLTLKAEKTLDSGMTEARSASIGGRGNSVSSDGAAYKTLTTVPKTTASASIR